MTDAPALGIADFLAAERAALKLFERVACLGNVDVTRALLPLELVSLRSKLHTAVAAVGVRLHPSHRSPATSRTRAGWDRPA
jgi:hypothetical protein